MVNAVATRRGTRVPPDEASNSPSAETEQGAGLQLWGVQELPWLGEALAATLRHQKGHAVMVHADPGHGSLEFAFGLAQAWLCESGDGAQRPCGQCVSCRLTRAQTHPDLMLRLPQHLALQHGMAVEYDDKRKPSRQIRVAELRAALDWSVTTSGRGRGKVLVIHPAETMNAVTASALLKTLEEPPAGMRIVLTTADPGLLLATISSRCQRVVLPRPQRPESLTWLQQRGVADAALLLDATGGRPLTALRWHADGLDARAWAAIPSAVARADATVFAAWPVPRMIDALQKLAHDAALRSCGAEPRFFPRASLPDGLDLAAAARWHQSLLRVVRHADHPWNEGLLAEALVSEGAQVWQGARATTQTARAMPRADTLSARLPSS